MNGWLSSCPHRRPRAWWDSAVSPASRTNSTFHSSSARWSSANVASSSGSASDRPSTSAPIVGLYGRQREPRVRGVGPADGRARGDPRPAATVGAGGRGQGGGGHRVSDRRSAVSGLGAVRRAAMVAVRSAHRASRGRRGSSRWRRHSQPAMRADDERRHLVESAGADCCRRVRQRGGEELAGPLVAGDDGQADEHVAGERIPLRAGEEPSVPTAGLGDDGGQRLDHGRDDDRHSPLRPSASAIASRAWRRSLTWRMRCS